MCGLESNDSFEVPLPLFIPIRLSASMAVKFAIGSLVAVFTTRLAESLVARHAWHQSADRAHVAQPVWAAVVGADFLLGEIWLTCLANGERAPLA